MKDKAYATYDEEPMVKDAPVSFELAKELNKTCHLSITNCDCLATYDTNGHLGGDFTTEQFPCPTIYNAASFIRANYGIDVIVLPIDPSTAYMGGERYFFKVYKSGRIVSLDCDKPAGRTYEETLESGLWWTVENIIKKK